MDSSSSASPAPFLVKTYEMVDDPYTDSVVSWSQTGHSFVVWNPPELAADLLPKYFKHNNFSSFIRQLNTYGFRKIDPDHWEFANEEFSRGQRHLLKNIHRRKPTHSHGFSDREEFEKEIQELERENNSLELETERRRTENQGYAHLIVSLDKSLHDIDHRQQRLANTLTRLLQNPELGLQNKRRKSLALHCFQDQSVFAENSMNLPAVKKLDSSLTSQGTVLRVQDSQSVSSLHSSEQSTDADQDLRVNRNVSPSKTTEVELAMNQGLDTGPNDTFWQQFLTEAPTSFMSREVESKADSYAPWWAANKVTGPSRTSWENVNV